MQQPSAVEKWRDCALCVQLLCVCNRFNDTGTEVIHVGLDDEASEEALTTYEVRVCVCTRARRPPPPCLPMSTLFSCSYSCHHLESCRFVLPLLSPPSCCQMIKETLKDITDVDAWKLVRVKLDAFHAMQRVSKTMKKSHGGFGSFCQDLRDALFVSRLAHQDERGTPPPLWCAMGGTLALWA